MSYMTGPHPSIAGVTAEFLPGPIEATTSATEAKRTLAERLAQGRLLVVEALRLSTSLADGLRRIHDEGRIYGCLTPSSIEVTSSGVVLLPPRTTPGLVTPYTAPELLRGRAPDIRSDIFAFGAILYEMISGRWPFEADTPESLSAALLSTPVRGTGNPAWDGLMANCLAKDPAARWQRMQRVQTELRLLTISTRCAEDSPRRENVEALIRTEVQQAVESRIATRLESQARSIVELQQALTASMDTLQSHLSTVDGKLATALETAATSEEATELHLRLSHVEQRVGASNEQIAQTKLILESETRRIPCVEQEIKTIRRRADEFSESIAVQLHAVEQTVASQAEALDETRTAVAQTDDLVERVVEALDSLQSIILERSEDKSS
jgi:serine/threonine protein kinase